MTKRLGNIMENGKFSFYELNGTDDRVQAILYLAKVYMQESNVSLTALDYRNIYNILYILCLPNFGKSLETARVGLAKEYVNKIKDGREKLPQLIEELLLTNYKN
jgi:hypothetical protein